MRGLGDIFGGESKALFGLDISSSNIKLVELSQSGSSYRIEHCACVPLPKDAVSEKEIKEPDLVGQAITKLLSRAGTSTKQAAVAVAGSSVITKIIEMSADLNDKELEEQIRVEADSYIPYPVEEVNLDFQVLGPSEHDPESNQLLLAACRSETVEMRAAAVEAAGVKPRVVDVEAHALENACQLLAYQIPDNGKDKTVAVVDIGNTAMTMLVLHEMETVYTREQSFGGHQLTLDIMRQYGMEEQEAEAAKLSGELPEDYSELQSHFLDDMAQQIQRALQFFTASATQYDRIDMILLAGGCANIAGAAERVQAATEISTQVADPFGDMKAGRKSKDAVAELSASMMTAAGLALRAFDS